MDLTKAERQAIDEIWETTLSMLQYHPDLSSFSPYHWEIVVKGVPMTKQFSGFVEPVCENEEDE